MCIPAILSTKDQTLVCWFSVLSSTKASPFVSLLQAAWTKINSDRFWDLFCLESGTNIINPWLKRGCGYIYFWQVQIQRCFLAFGAIVRIKVGTEHNELSTKYSWRWRRALLSVFSQELYSEPNLLSVICTVSCFLENTLSFNRTTTALNQLSCWGKTWHQIHFSLWKRLLNDIIFCFSTREKSFTGFWFRCRFAVWLFIIAFQVDVVSLTSTQEIPDNVQHRCNRLDGDSDSVQGEPEVFTIVHEASPFHSTARVVEHASVVNRQTKQERGRETWNSWQNSQLDRHVRSIVVFHKKL